MRHEIPTHIDVEDRVLGPLTMRQILLLAAGVSISYATWSFFEAFLPAWFVVMVAAIPAIVTFLFAFVQPNHRSLDSWLLAVLRYMTLPKIYVWRKIN